MDGDDYHQIDLDQKRQDEDEVRHRRSNSRHVDEGCRLSSCQPRCYKFIVIQRVLQEHHHLKNPPQETLLILVKIITRESTISADEMSAAPAVEVKISVVGGAAAAAVEESHDGERFLVRNLFFECLQDELMQGGSRIGTDFVFLARSIWIVCPLERFDISIPFPELLNGLQ